MKIERAAAAAAGSSGPWGPAAGGEPLAGATCSCRRGRGACGRWRM